MIELSEISDKVIADGFALIPAVYTNRQCADMLAELNTAMQLDRQQLNVRESRGTVFAARNVVEMCPASLNWWQEPPLIALLDGLLGAGFGLVRVLYFDKPSDRSWSLPFHKDMTIAVKTNQLRSNEFSKPTNKAGVDHVEAPTWLLQQMLTLRLHLDDVTASNGPLQVIPRTHLAGKETNPTSPEPIKILCDQGDVLAMRPLVCHGSAHSLPESNLRRRILHLEFCGRRRLPDEFEWSLFYQG